MPSGGDGIKTFNLPDLRGAAVIGGSSNGVASGAPAVTLTTAQIPQHNHTLSASTAAGAGRGSTPTNNFFGVATGSPPEMVFGLAGSAEVPLADSTNVGPSGGGQPHENMQPYMVINYLIALQGLYPSRG